MFAIPPSFLALPYPTLHAQISYLFGRVASLYSDTLAASLDALQYRGPAWEAVRQANASYLLQVRAGYDSSGWRLMGVGGHELRVGRSPTPAPAPHMVSGASVPLERRQGLRFLRSFTCALPCTLRATAFKCYNIPSFNPAAALQRL